MSMKWEGNKSLEALSGRCVGWCLSTGAREHIESLGWAHYTDKAGICYWKRTRRSERVYRPLIGGGSVLTLMDLPPSNSWRSAWIFQEGNWYRSGDPYLYPHRQPGDEPSTAEKRLSYIRRAFPNSEARAWATGEMNGLRPAARYHLFRKWWRGIVEGYPDHLPSPTLLPVAGAQMSGARPRVPLRPSAF